MGISHNIWTPEIYVPPPERIFQISHEIKVPPWNIGSSYLVSEPNPPFDFSRVWFRDYLISTCAVGFFVGREIVPGKDTGIYKMSRLGVRCHNDLRDEFRRRRQCAGVRRRRERSDFGTGHRVCPVVTKTRNGTMAERSVPFRLLKYRIVVSSHPSRISGALCYFMSMQLGREFREVKVIIYK